MPSSINREYFTAPVSAWTAMVLVVKLTSFRSNLGECLGGAYFVLGVVAVLEASISCCCERQCTVLQVRDRGESAWLVKQAGKSLEPLLWDGLRILKYLGV